MQLNLVSHKPQDCNGNETKSANKLSINVFPSKKPGAV